MKIDNLVQIAHNVHIGEHTVIAAQTGISGSSTVGKRAMIGGQVGIADHCTLEDGAIRRRASRHPHRQNNSPRSNRLGHSRAPAR